MNLGEMLRKECIGIDVDMSDKRDALKTVARLTKQYEGLAGIDERMISKKLEEREGLGSTGFGKGIAIPHCRVKGLKEFLVGIITTTRGVPFEAVDGGDVHLIVFIIGPDEETNEHIRVLSLISRILHTPGIVEELLAQRSPDALYESFLRHSREHVPVKEKGTYRLCQVFIQDEDLFHEVLQVLASIDTASLTIIEGKNTREFLVAMPLFAGFWSDTHLGFNKIILAVIDASLTNETLRAIENVTGDLTKRSDILVLVQDLFYAAGSLEA